MEGLGFEVVRARRVEDAVIAVQTDAAIGCMVVDWGKRGIDGKATALINLMRKRGLEMPIVIMVRRKRLEDIPVELLDFIDGYSSSRRKRLSISRAALSAASSNTPRR